ncbi:MAG: hypothetical protein M1358_16085 [Chloroflexi bacterium]|nr:hypothetical protein [Chloroflexota bacterium]
MVNNQVARKKYGDGQDKLEVQGISLVSRRAAAFAALKQVPVPTSYEQQAYSEQVRLILPKLCQACGTPETYGQSEGG